MNDVRLVVKEPDVAEVDILIEPRTVPKYLAKLIAGVKETASR
ncbi:hypothetical protein PXK18_22875 [Phaeobacter gallaeciensis]|nr:hypothetical protein [Phaeobacter gallaeciensis]